MPRTATPAVEPGTIDQQIAAVAAELDQVRGEMSRTPYYLRGTSRLYLGQAERKQRLLAQLESLRRLKQLSE